MNDAVANLLLRITGDSDDAQRELRELAAELQAISRSDADADVDVHTGGARVELAALMAELSRIDGKDVTVDVNIDRHGEARAAVSGLIGLLPDLGGAATEAAGSGGGGIAGLSTKMGPLGFSGAASGAGAAALGLVAILAGALVAGIAALISSAAAATAGLGALAVAGFGAILPVAALAAGAIARFKAQANIAGTAAHALKGAFDDLLPAMQKAVGPGADAMMRGLAAAVRAVIPAVAELRGPFTVLGKAIGDALKAAGPALAKLIGQFGELIVATAPLVGPVLDGLISLGSILANIATAAMPILVAAAQELAGWLQNVADQTSNIGALRSAIGGLVSHLASWLNLAKQVSAVMLSFFAAAAPAGQGLVNWLALGAQHLASWLKSEPGRQAIRQFFTDVLPLVQQLISFIARFGVLFFQAVQMVAPGLTMLLTSLNALLAILIQVVAWLMPLLQTMSQIGTVVTGLAPQLLNLGGVFTALSELATAAWNQIRAATETLAAALATTWAAIRAAAVIAWTAIRAAAVSIWGTIRSAITNAANQATSSATASWNAGRAALTSIWNGLRSTATAVWSGMRSAITAATNATRSAVVSAWNSAKSSLNTIWAGIRSQAASAWRSIRSLISTSIREAVSSIRSMASDFYSAGRALIARLADGIRAGFSEALSAVGDGLSALRNKLPFSEPKDHSSPVYGLAKSGKALMENFAAGIPAGAHSLARVLTAELSMLPITNLSVPGGPAPGHGPVSIHRTYNIPPGPGGGMDPLFAASQLDQLMRNEGGLQGVG